MGIKLFMFLSDINFFTCWSKSWRRNELEFLIRGSALGHYRNIQGSHNAGIIVWLHLNTTWVPAFSVVVIHINSWIHMIGLNAFMLIAHMMEWAFLSKLDQLRQSLHSWPRAGMDHFHGPRLLVMSCDQKMFQSIFLKALVIVYNVKEKNSPMSRLNILEQF